MFNVIVVDPPWEYENKKTGGSHKSGSQQKYNTLSIEQVKSLYITSNLSKITSKDSVLFLWTTTPLLDQAFEVMKAWKFKYKTMITWRKIMNQGMGYWFRGQTEHILLGVKGNVNAFRFQHPNFIQSKVGKHSEKPISSYTLIEQATKNINPKYLELFATRQYKNWTCLGYNISGNDITVDISNLIQ